MYHLEGMVGCGGWQEGIDRQEEGEESYKGLLKTDHTQFKGWNTLERSQSKKKEEGWGGVPILE